MAGIDAGSGEKQERTEEMRRKMAEAGRKAEEKQELAPITCGV